ncbi:MAG: glucose-1-phosphate adenylyltransferase [Candidatus Eremiobacteraeota bacterium]|nr:glucose-1-phosphate adenylyltransferase [Candidatus Eremiobacteraeota bacterium]
MQKIMGIIMAGGEGKRLEVLTSDIRAKPAVPFGGKYRIIDFVLTNFFHSGIKKLYVLIQHRSFSLVDHVEHSWNRRFGSRSEYVRCIGPAPPVWYRGTADCIYQNMIQINQEMPDLVAVFGGDHIYKMNIESIIDFHRAKGAHLTVCARAFPIEHARSFGVIQVDENYRMIDFEEKPQNPKHIPGDPAHALVSMGNYIFNRDVLVDALKHDAHLPARETSHDFGKNVIPRLSKMKGMKVFVYDFMDNRWSREPVKESEVGYWRDVGTVDSYFESNMDLVGVNPIFNLYDKSWPIYSAVTDSLPPAKFVFSGSDRRGEAINSIVCDGCIISGGYVEESILSPEVRVNSFSRVSHSIIFDNVDIGRRCVLERVIIDKNVKVPAGTVITGGRVYLQDHVGFEYDVQDFEQYKEEQAERMRIFRKLLEKAHTTASGIVVIPRYYEYYETEHH